MTKASVNLWPSSTSLRESDLLPQFALSTTTLRFQVIYDHPLLYHPHSIQELRMGVEYNYKKYEIPFLLKSSS